MARNQVSWRCRTCPGPCRLSPTSVAVAWARSSVSSRGCRRCPSARKTARVGTVRMREDIVHDPRQLGERSPLLLLLPLLVNPGAVLEVEPRKDVVDGSED